MNNFSWGSRMGLVAAGIAAAVLVGCKVGPDYKGMKTHMPGQWPAEVSGASSQPSRAVADPLKDGRWWHGFNDAELTKLVEEGMVRNLDVRVATARLREARATRGIVAAGLYPGLNSSGTAVRSRTPVGGGGFTGSTFQAGFDAAWELDVFGGVRRNIESAEADAQAQVESLRDVQVTLAAEVATDYIALRGLQEQLRIAQENLEADRRNLELTRKRFAGGIVGKLDVANAQAQVSTTESGIPTIRTNLQQTMYALAVLLAEEPDALTAQLGGAGEIPAAPATVPIGLPSELLRRRPDIRAAEWRIKSATAKIGVATADLFPKFSLTGQLGLESSKLTSFSNWNNRFWSFGPSATWNIFDAGRIVSNIHLQEGLRDETVVTYEKTVLTALQEVDSALAAFGNEQLRRDALTSAVEANRQAVDFAQQLYREGHTDFLNVLSAQRSLLASRESLAESRQNIANDLVALYKALGGGWEEGGR